MTKSQREKERLERHQRIEEELKCKYDEIKIILRNFESKENDKFAFFCILAVNVK
jgi:hypothetical protein